MLVDPTVIRDPNDMREDERIAEMGKPKLGDHSKIRVTVKESQEFKVGVGWSILQPLSRFDGMLCV